ncbi:uncharacterized protein [Anoplolepis gracilipes]|uniref:uncharacterized protein isoform X2 n=1 Tax=Anoplolepis gracilipes TaxID=354296 RepID=UPI003BA119C0
MQPLGVLLLLLTCQLATSIPISDRDGTGLHRGYRSAGFGETIRDWFSMIKNRVVGKWREWFGNDGPTPSLSPQDILNIDKTIGNRIPGYPGLFLDLFTGNYNSDSDSDEWDIRPLLPNLPSPPMFGIDWTPNIHEFEIPKTTQLPTNTPKIDLTTPRQQTSQTVSQTESVLTESTVTLAEPIPFTTQLTATSTDSIAASSEEILTSTESTSSITNDESVTISTESILTSTETITVSIESTVPSTESAVTSTESIIPSIDTMLNSTESIVTSIESTAIVTESTATSTEEIITSTITELPDRTTSTELILPVFNKKIEDNETVNIRTTKKPRPASAEVITF